MKIRVLAIILTLFLVSRSDAPAIEREVRGFSLGTFHSFKGIGFSASLNEQHSFALYADTEGVFSGHTVSPGFRFTYLYHYPLFNIRTKDGSVFNFYAGPGVTTGLIREKIAYGWMGGISGCAGVQVCLRKHFLISLEFESDVGFFFTDDSNSMTKKLKFYNKGLSYVWYPQLRIEYDF